MFIILVIAIGIGIGLLRGRRINFHEKPCMLWYLGLIGFSILVGMRIYFYTGGISELSFYLPMIHYVGYLLILIMLVFNLDNIWSNILTVGVVLNFIVIFFNGGKIPVSTWVLNTPGFNHLLLLETISDGSNGVFTTMYQDVSILWFLGVTIPIPYIGNITSIFGSVPGVSLGDLIIGFALIMWIQRIMQKNSQFLVQDNGELIKEKSMYVGKGGDKLMGLFKRNGKKEKNVDVDNLANDYNDFDNGDNFDLFDGIHPNEVSLGGFDQPYVDTHQQEKLGVDNLYRDNQNDQNYYEPAQDSHETTFYGEPESTENYFPNTTYNNMSSASETKIFTTFNDLGSVDNNGHSGLTEKKIEDGLSNVTKYESSFYNNNENKSKEEQGYTKIISKVNDDSLLRTSKDKKDTPIIEDNPFKSLNTKEVKKESESKIGGVNRKYNPYSTKELGDNMNKVEIGRSEEEMRNIWSRVAHENELLRKKQSVKLEEIPLKTRSEQPVKPVVQAQESSRTVEDKGEIIPPAFNNERGWEIPGTQISSEMDVVEGKKEQVSMKSSVNEANDRQREKAGFEKVIFTIDNRDVAVWRKRK